MSTISAKEPGPPNVNRPNFVVNGYRLIRKLGSGSFGEIFLAKCTLTGEQLAVKLEDANCPHPQLKRERKLYTALQGKKGFPKLHWYGTARDYNIMVLDLLGPSLEDLFDFCGRKFSLKTVLMLADQMLTRLEVVHSKGYIHRDIKPENCLMGVGITCNRVHLIDFGLAKKFLNSETREHIEFSEHHNLSGTPRYASMCTHLGMETSRRDDLASLGYVLMYFLRAGDLPWKGLMGATKKEKTDRIREVKLVTSHAALCEGYPIEFQEYLEYVDQLKFEELPDYEYLRGKFLQLFYSKEFEFDYRFDWTLYKPDDIDMGVVGCFPSSSKTTEILGPPISTARRRVIRD